MGDKSPKSKQRDRDQKAATEKASQAKAKTKRDAQTRVPPTKAK